MKAVPSHEIFVVIDQVKRQNDWTERTERQLHHIPVHVTDHWNFPAMWRWHISNPAVHYKHCTLWIFMDFVLVISLLYFIIYIFFIKLHSSLEKKENCSKLYGWSDYFLFTFLIDVISVTDTTGVPAKDRWWSRASENERQHLHRQSPHRVSLCRKGWERSGDKDVLNAQSNQHFCMHWRVACYWHCNTHIVIPH